ncbi:PepSY domain-containing protein [Paracandidimonas soli]|uniref:PepSY domain-containing protein n=1 Tax=Paracandidimonas soli TaxID=1917182 RepID=UPI00333EC8BA
MTIRTRTKRLVYLVHRWTGVAGCVLMALWFISGVVMLYVGYPKLTPWERLGPLPALAATDCCTPPDAILDDVSPSAAGLVLTSVGGEPSYVLRDARNRLRVLVAADGAPRQPVTPERALAEARVFAPTATLRHAGEIHEDRWTHSRGLDAHRPLHRIQLGGDSPGLLYISSTTGQAVMDAPLAQQRWNYVGAWLHWLYMFRDRPVDPAWSWLVIALSAMCTVTAVTGMTVGLWRWRFRSRYKSGARTPYQEGWMRWHHIIGLAFSAFVCTWIFSGLMSMNPLDIFSPAHGRPDVAAYRGSPAVAADALKQPARIIHTLEQTGFSPVELHWRSLGSEEYVLAYDASVRTRVVRADMDDTLSVTDAWQPDAVMSAAQRLFAFPPAASRMLTEYDIYYYQRHPEAMNGARLLGLPALRLDYEDAGGTRVYIDLRTGEVAMSLDRSQRASRWLFYFLHSWDTPALLRMGPARDLAIIALSVGGLAISLTGVVIGWRRLRGKQPWRQRIGR